MNLRTVLRRLSGADALARTEDLAAQLTKARDDNQTLVEALTATRNERDQHRAASALANRLGFRIAQAVGIVAEGETRVELANPEQVVELLEQLIADRDRLSQRFAECDQQNEQATTALAVARRENADAATFAWLAGHHKDTIRAVAALLKGMRGRAAREALDRIERDAAHAEKYLAEQRAQDGVTPEGEPDHD